MAFEVEQHVITFRGKQDQRIFSLEQTVTDLRLQIDDLQFKLKSEVDEKIKLAETLKRESDLVESFKDPEGMSAFRLVLQDMEAGIMALQREKQFQYETMNQSILLMEGMDKAQNSTIDECNVRLEQK